MGRGEARITLLEGTASIMADGQKAWRPLAVGMTLKGGDQVNIENKSRMEIRLPDQSVLRFADNTRFKIQKIDISRESNARTAVINVALGKTWANVNKSFGVKPNYEIASRNAVCGVRGTVYRMNVEDNQSVLVRVYEGEVNVSGGSGPERVAGVDGPPKSVAGPVSIPGPVSVTMEQWVYIVKSMQQIRISGDGIAHKPESFTEEEDRDAWVDWNKARDAGMDKAGPDEEGTGAGAWLFPFGH
ncbi:MAG: FecR domain-containing protein [Syntrophales bacterium]